MEWRGRDGWQVTRVHSTKSVVLSTYDGIIINPQWLERPMSRTISYGPKDVRAIGSTVIRNCN